MAIFRWGNSLDPLAALRSMQRDMDRLMELPRLVGEGQRVGGGSFPPVNVYNGEDDIIVLAEVPGLRGEDLDLSITGETLVLKGTKRFQPDEEKVRFHRRERGGGEFIRTIILPDRVEAGRISAKLSDGILRITLPKSEAARPRRIAVEAQPEGAQQ